MRNAFLFLGIPMIGCLFTYLNMDLPVLRNSWDYTQLVQILLQAKYNLSEIVHSPSLNFGRPLGFPLFSMPFVWLAGPHDGMLLSSMVGSCLFFLVSLLIFNIYAPKKVNHFIFYVLFFLNPLIIYQFWSAHADSLFAAFYLFSLYAFHHLLKDKKSLKYAFMFVSSTLFTLMIKYYGLILLPSFLIMFIHSEKIHRNWFDLKKYEYIYTGIILISLFVILGYVGINPIWKIGTSSAGMDVYLGKKDIHQLHLILNLIGVLCFFILCFNVLFSKVIFCVVKSYRNPLFIIISIYALGIIFFPHAFYNTRLYLPIFPLILILFLQNLKWNRMSPFMIAIFLNCLSILIFNTSSISKLTQPVLNQFGRAVLFLDNLRMPQHLAFQAAVNNLNLHVPENRKIHVISDYRQGAFQGMLQLTPTLKPTVKTEFYLNLKDYLEHKKSGEILEAYILIAAVEGETKEINRLMKMKKLNLFEAIQKARETYMQKMITNFSQIKNIQSLGHSLFKISY
jgi:hypothetical protein